MRIIRFADLAPTPWKNRGGLTREYAVYPEGAGLDTFAWRVSSAEIRRDGAFSRFENTTRTLVIVSGSGIELTLGGSSVHLDGLSAPFAFSGDIPARAHLAGGAVRDLNVMTRRDLWRHEVRRQTLVPGRPITPRGTVIILVATEACRIGVGDGSERLAPADAILWVGAGAEARAIGASATSVIVVTLDPCDQTRDGPPA